MCAVTKVLLCGTQAVDIAFVMDELVDWCNSSCEHGGPHGVVNSRSIVVSRSICVVWWHLLHCWQPLQASSTGHAQQMAACP